MPPPRIWASIQTLGSRTSYTARRSLATARARGSDDSSWAHPPASAEIDNDQLSRLTAKPLHTLTLADLIRQLSLMLDDTVILANNYTPGTVVPRFPQRTSLTLPTLRSLSYRFALLIAYKPFAISLLLSSPIQTSLVSTTPMSTRCRPSSRTKKNPLPACKMKSNLQRS